MTAEASSFALPLGAPQRSGERSWISSPWFDAVFFIGSPLVVLPIVLLAVNVSPRFGVLFFFLAFPHYFSTFAFFFWDEYQARHKARWVAFFAGPVLLAALYWSLFYFSIPRVIQVALFVWNMWHVARQSGGILSIYRHRAGVFDPLQKSATNWAILSTNMFLAFWNIETHLEFMPTLLNVSPGFPQMVKYTLGGIAAFCVARLAWALRRRVKAGQPILGAEIAFFATSILIFHPYLWAKTSSFATAVMLLPHYLQYLGLVWLVHRRRFQTEEGSTTQRILGKISSQTPLLIMILLGLGAASTAGAIFFRRAGHPAVFESLYLLLAFEHFYLDGLFWAFRDPSVRKSIGPLLTSFKPAAERAAA
jgi:hypothetical protein